MVAVLSSSFARLLVAATSGGNDNSRTASGKHETFTSLRDSSRFSAERKARVLSKHRPALVRWTGGAESSTPTRRRQRQQGYLKVPTCDSDPDSSTNSTQAIPPALGLHRKEDQTQSDFVSPLLSLVSSDSLGRHIVAGGGKISPGTLLLREAPFAWSLHPEFRGTFCAHCLCEIAGSTVCCRACKLVAYCSVSCETAASQTWHGSECLDPFTGSPLEPAMSGVSPACKVALRACRRLAKDKSEPASNEEEYRSKVLGKDLSSRATTATSASSAVTGVEGNGSGTLQSNSGGVDVEWPMLDGLQEHYIPRSERERELLGTEAAVAAVLARGDSVGGRGVRADSDRVSNNGGDDTPTGRETLELLVSELVTTLFKVSTNAFTVSTLRCSEPRFGGSVRPMTHTKVAVALYLAAAMFNHSCAPNALVTFHGGEIRVIATRAIGKGEPVTISYGPLVSKVPSTPDRQAYLQNTYFFRCECVACCPPAATGTTPPCRDPREDKDGHEEDTVLVRAAVTSSKRTDFACTDAEGGACPGTLLAGVRPPRSPSPPPLPSQEERCHVQTGAGVRTSTTLIHPAGETKLVSDTVAPPLAFPLQTGESNVDMWCDSCGSRVLPSAVDALLREDEEDRRLWDELNRMASFLEGEESGDAVGRRIGRLSPSSSPPPRRHPSEHKVSSLAGPPQPRANEVDSRTTSSIALRLAVERVKWRDSHLSPQSMRRAVAHDMHARLLSAQDDFAGAADACARAVHLLVKMFALEDQELGLEFLKLAELCFSAGWMDKCSSACRKARVSLGVCLQRGDEILSTLDNLEEISTAVAYPSGRR